MIDQDLTNLLLAVVIATSLHAAMEPFNIRNKVRRLNDALFGTNTARKTGPIDSTLKALGFIVVMLAVATGVAYVLLGFIDPTAETAVWTAVVLLLVVEVVNTLHIDKYHQEMGETMALQAGDLPE